MAVLSIAKRASAKITLNAGTNPETGRAITRTTTLSGLAANPNGEKIYAVVDAAAAVLDYPVTSVETTEVKTLEKTA